MRLLSTSVVCLLSVSFYAQDLIESHLPIVVIEYENDVQATAMSEILNIPVDTIMKNKGAFFVDNKKKSNYHKLPATKQKELDIQIEQMIMAKYGKNLSKNYLFKKVVRCNE